MAHAYFVAGEAEQGIARAVAFAERELGITGLSDPDLVVLRYQHFSIDEARKLADVAVAAPVGEHKAIIVSATRFFIKAQNALLKLFEEPPRGIILILVLPSEGLLIATLRSRLSELPAAASSATELALSDLGRAFLAADSDERQKIVNRLVDKAKSDKEEDKQQARVEAMRLTEDLIRVAERAYRGAQSAGEQRAYRLLLQDLNHFLPLLHTPSAPLKLVFEHLLIVIPKSLRMAEV